MSTLHIIGVNRRTLAFREFQAHLLNRAALHEIVVGLEGVLHNSKATDAYLYQRFGLQGAYASGLEEELPLVVDHIFLSYMVFTVTQYERQHRTSAKLQTLDDLYNLHAFRQLWQDVSIQPLLPAATFSLIRNLNTLIKKAADAPRSQVYRAFQEHHQELGDQRTWTDLFRRLGNAAVNRLEKLPSAQQPDLKAVAVILDRPQSEEGEQAYTSDIRGWRNASVLINLAQVAGYAADRSLDTYFQLDSARAEDVAQHINPNRRFITKLSLFQDGMPMEYLLKANA